MVAGHPHKKRYPRTVLLGIMLLSVILLAIGQARAEVTVVKVRPRQSAEDQSYDYFIDLLKMALRKTEASHGPYRIEVTPLNAPQGRALKELAGGRWINVDWAGTNKARERLLTPIRIPLIGGLLGYRVPVIRKRNVPLFRKIQTLDSLKLFTAVQGAHWPDADILESAGLKVYRVPQFKQMYPMLKAGRVDYFPRGINEVYSEVEKATDGRLVAFDELLIAYPLPMYFFTSRDDKKLARRIEVGLRQAIDDGSFRAFMKQSPVTAPLFPLTRYDDSRIIAIDNPDLPQKTPLADPSLWITLGRDAAMQ